MSAFEDEHGTYIMNSKDLRAIQHVERLTQLGVHSLKIEGRTKSFYYCARTARSTAAPSTTRPPANPSIRPCLPLWKARRTAATPKASYAATCTKRSRITTTAPRSPSASSLSANSPACAAMAGQRST